MVLKNKVAQAEYERLRTQYHYGEAQAEEEAKVYARLVAAAKPKKKRQSKKAADA